MRKCNKLLKVSSIFYLLYAIAVIMYSKGLGGFLLTIGIFLLTYSFLDANIPAIITVGICATAFMGIPLTIADYRDKKIVVYCRSGHRCITACNILSMEGFDDLYNLEKGIIDYVI